MRRSWLERCASVLLAFWLVVNLAEPASLHACPMHGGGATAGSSAPAAGGGHNHAATHVSSSKQSPSDDSGTGHKYCSCPGKCCSHGVGVTVPTIRVAFVDVVVQFAEPAAHDVGIAAAAAEHLLPFSIGPPRA
jgi:hypothetical protein